MILYIFFFLQKIWFLYYKVLVALHVPYDVYSYMYVKFANFVCKVCNIEKILRVIIYSIDMIV